MTECTENDEVANLVFSSVHKAKGSQQDFVYLKNDFSEFRSNSNVEEEVNIFFVAATRAKVNLFIHEDTAQRILKINHLIVNKIICYIIYFKLK